MSRAQLGGALICLGTVALAGLFIWGVAVENWLALAIPLALVFLSVLALAFWIGWTIATTKTEAPKPEPNETSESQ